MFKKIMTWVVVLLALVSITSGIYLLINKYHKDLFDLTPWIETRVEDVNINEVDSTSPIDEMTPL